MMAGFDLKKLFVDCGKRLGMYKYVVIVIAAGLILLLWPQGKEAAAEKTEEINELYFVEELEAKIEEALGCIDGVGMVSVSLTVKSGIEYVFVQDCDMRNGEESSETVIVSAGSGIQEVIVQNTIYPTYLGALVVCQGGDDPNIKLQVTQAVSSLTGLGSGRITVCKGEHFF